MLESLLILLLFCVPLIASIISTTVRLKDMRRRHVPISFHISDLLIAVLCIGVATTIFIPSDYISILKGAIIAGIAVGLVAGKIWYLSSVTKSFVNSAAYLFIGAFIWSVAALGTAATIAMFLYWPVC